MAKSTKVSSKEKVELEEKLFAIESQIVELKKGLEVADWEKEAAKVELRKFTSVAKIQQRTS